MRIAKFYKNSPKMGQIIILVKSYKNKNYWKVDFTYNECLIHDFFMKIANFAGVVKYPLSFLCMKISDCHENKMLCTFGVSNATIMFDGYFFPSWEGWQVQTWTINFLRSKASLTCCKRVKMRSKWRKITKNSNYGHSSWKLKSFKLIFHRNKKCEKISYHSKLCVG